MWSVSACMLQTEPAGFPDRVDVAGAERESRTMPRFWPEETDDGVAFS